MNEPIECEEWLDALNMSLVKALVWFWWIDETLIANLVYHDYEIGSTTPSDEANEDHDMMMMMAWWWSNAWTWKEVREKQKLKAKVKLIGAFQFSDRDT